MKGNKKSKYQRIVTYKYTDRSRELASICGSHYSEGQIVIDLGWSVYWKSVPKIRKSGSGGGWLGGWGWPTFQLLFLRLSKMTKFRYVYVQCVEVGGGGPICLGENMG